MTETCLFCGIAEGRVPAQIVHSDDRVLAFRDIAPVAPTHLLVIPRAHHRDVLQLVAADPALAEHVLAVAAAVAEAAGVAGGCRLVFNTGADGGQSVFHAHCHVLGGRTLEWPPG